MLASRPVHRLLFVNQSIGPLSADLVVAASRLMQVDVFPGLSYRRSSFYIRLLTWLGFSVQLAWHLLWRGRQYKCLLVVSNPPLAPLLSPIARRPYALLLYDLYPHVLAQLTPRRHLQRQVLSLLMWLWNQANRYVLPRAEYVFTLSASMADQLRPYFATKELWRERVMVIPPWADTINMYPKPSEGEIFRRRHGLEGLLLTYSGNLGITHPLEPLLEACALIEALPAPPRVQMLLIGSGPKRAGLQSQARLLQLPASRLRFLDPLPYSELPASISAADLAVVALDGPAAAASLPSKTFNALACGTPLLVLAPANSALAKLVHNHNCGLVIEPGPDASQQLVDLIIYLASTPGELHRLASNALAASRHYTPKNADRLVEAWLGPAPVHCTNLYT